MTVESAADRAAMIADFGEPVTYQRGDAPAIPMAGMFDAAYVEVAEGGGAGVASRGRSITVAADVLPAEAQRGDVVVAAEGTFAVADVKPDGTGIVHLILERI